MKPGRSCEKVSGFQRGVFSCFSLSEIRNAYSTAITIIVFSLVAEKRRTTNTKAQKSPAKVTKLLRD